MYLLFHLSIWIFNNDRWWNEVWWESKRTDKHNKSKIHTLTHLPAQSTLSHLICSYLSFLIISHFSTHQLAPHRDSAGWLPARECPCWYDGDASQPAVLRAAAFQGAVVMLATSVFNSPVVLTEAHFLLLFWGICLLRPFLLIVTFYSVEILRGQRSLLRCLFIHSEKVLTFYLSMLRPEIWP